METIIRLVISFISLVIGIYIGRSPYKKIINKINDTQPFPDETLKKVPLNQSKFDDLGNMFTNSGLSLKNIIRLKYQSLCYKLGEKNVPVVAWIFLNQSDIDKVNWSEVTQEEITHLSKYRIDGERKVYRAFGITCIMAKYDERANDGIRFKDTPSSIWFFQPGEAITLNQIWIEFEKYRNNVDREQKNAFIEFFTL